MNNYYQLLQVSTSASADEIQSAWRNLAKKLHPDAGGDAVLFGLVQQAYETLQDADKRRAYDETVLNFHNEGGVRGTAGFGSSTGFVHKSEWSRNTSGKEGTRTATKSTASSGKDMVHISALALPRNGVFVLSAPGGETVINPTEALRLWNSTLAKLQGVHSQQIARHIVQLEMEGPQHYLKRLSPVPKNSFSSGREFTGAGLLGRTLERMGSQNNLPSAEKFLLECNQLPVNLLITVPSGIAVEVCDLSRPLTIGDLNSQLSANLLPGGQLVAAELCGLTLRMQQAYARVIELSGNAEVHARGQCKLVLNGQIGRLQVDLDNNTEAIIHADVHTLSGSIRGGSTLDMRGNVFRVRCSSEQDGFLKLKKVRDFSPPTASTFTRRRG